METTDPAEALNRIMEANGWLQRQLGRELGGLTQQWVSSVLTGRRDPGIKRYATYLGRVGWEVVIRPKTEEQVKRREFHENLIKVASGALAGQAASIIDNRARMDNPFRDPDYILGIARRISDMREELGGVPIAQKVLGQTRSVNVVLPQGGKELHIAASEFLRQAAWVFLDSGRPDLAERQARRSLSLAGNAEDTERQAAAHATLCDMFLVEKKNPDRAAFHAKNGLDLPGLSDNVRAPLNAYLGWALGQNDKVRSTRLRSQKLVNKALNINGLSSADSAWVQHVSGLVLHNLGEDRQALSSFAQTVQFGDVGLEAHALADAAKIALSNRQLDHAEKLMGALSYVVP